MFHARSRRSAAPSRLAAVVACFGLIGLIALAAPAQETDPSPPPAPPEGATFSETVQVRVVDIVVQVQDESGATPTDLGAADFRVVVDGVEQRVVRAALASPAARAEAAAEAASEPAAAAEPAAVPEPAVQAPPELNEWTTVVYFDQPLLAMRSVGRIADALAADAAALTAMGPVEVVFAAPVPRTVLPATRNAGELATALRTLGNKAHGGQELLAIRRAYQQALGETDMSDVMLRASEASAPRPRQGRGGAGGDLNTVADRTTERRDDPFRDTGRKLARQRMAARHAARAEAAVLSRQRTFLLDWLAGYGGGKPRALLLASDGYDEDPREYYLSGIDSERTRGELRNELEDASFGPASEEIQRVLAAHGWTVVPMAVGGLAAADLADAAVAGRERYRQFAGSKYSIAGGRAYTGTSGQGSLFTSPLAPLVDLADATGGDLVVDERKLGDAVRGLGERYVVTYQLSDPPDGLVRDLEISVRRPGIRVDAPRYVAEVSPEAVAVLRARRLLEGAERTGDLPTVVESTRGEAKGDTVPVRLRATVDLGPLDAVREKLSGTSVRATVAVLLPDGRVFVNHQAARQNLSHLEDWHYDATLNVPTGSTLAALVVEELTTGAWGGGATSFPAGDPAAP